MQLLFTVAAAVLASVCVIAVLAWVVLRRLAEPGPGERFNALFPTRREPGSSPYDRLNDHINPPAPDLRSLAERLDRLEQTAPPARRGKPKES